jgi:2-polyprenyl-3-methyl-5-hydroxy-6-metoxy-1,4-benzoquinol methylase
MERYVIRGGRAGYDRLQVLTRDRWPTIRALFARAGVGAGMRCVDLGCGGGEVTFELAKLVAPGGDVVGVDMDEVKLALARDAAADRGITNVEFRALNVNAWDEPAAYDVVYGRFLLQHLRQPVALLRRMWAAVRPGERWLRLLCASLS